ncbi:MAG: glycosyltransferase family 39 protein [Vicinamibacteria bacterium]|nr:glycosyltransferase family 39 protein [Vicinamibacteria bacterium]
MSRRAPGGRLWVLALGLSVLASFVWGLRFTRSGLALQVRQAGGGVVASFEHASLNTLRTEALQARNPSDLRAEWVGYWDVPAPGFDELVLKSDGVASARLGDAEIAATGPHRIRSRIPPGPRRLSVTYEPAMSGAEEAPHREIFLKGVTSDGRSIPLARSRTSTRPLSPVDEIARWLSVILAAGALFSWGRLFLLGVKEAGLAAMARRWWPAVAAVLVLVAGALRFEAVVVTYWGVEAPDWAEGLSSAIRDLRPGGFEHAPTTHPYEGDPFSYLMIARTMGAFYEPSVREPLFPALTRVALMLSGGRDIGINFVSAISSTLVALVIFALGYRLSSALSGAIAAFLWTVEWQAIVLSTQGWRDDLFALLVTTCVVAMLALRRSPDRLTGSLLGIAGGLALLTRLTSFSFLIPGVAAVLLLPAPASRGDRVRAAGLAALWMLLLAGPFMAACAIGYGDPFHAINVHAAFYSRRAGHGATANVSQMFSTLMSPWEFVQTGLTGLTSHPFSNKWFGIGALLPGLDEAARILALAGLPVLLWRADGVVAIVAFLGAIAPYAWTWNIPGGDEWRFTLPIYPLFLVSAAVAVETGWGISLGLTRSASRRDSGRAIARYAATAALLAGFGSWSARWLEWRRVSEAIESRRPAVIGPEAGARVFFQSGWKSEAGAGKAASFAIVGPEARLRLPIPADLPARVVMRVGAAEGPLRDVRLLVGDMDLGTIRGQPGRADLAAVTLDARAPRSRGAVELRFLSPGSAADSSPLVLLWVRIEPF